MLVRAWAILVVLTLASMAAGRAEGGLGLAAVTAVLALTGYKAGQVAMVFLDLRQAPLAWRAGFWAWLGVIGAAILAAHAVALAA